MSLLTVLLALATFLVAVCILVVIVRRDSQRDSRRQMATLDLPLEELIPNGAESVEASRRVRQAERLVFGPDVSPLITIEAAAGSDFRTQDCHIPDATRTHLSHLLAGAPTAALAGIGLASRSGTYLLTFAPSVQAGLADGSLQLMEAGSGGWRALATDGTRIAGQGSLMPAGLSAISIGAAVWAVAAYITAQKYLSDINERLDALQQGIDRLQQWSEFEIRSQIETDMRYLGGIYKSLGSGDVDKESMSRHAAELERIDAGSSSIINNLRQRINHEVSALENRPIKITLISGGTLEGNRKRLLNAAEEVRRWIADLVATLHVKGATAQLRCALPGNVQFASHRIGDLKRDIADAEYLLDRFKLAMENRIDELVGSRLKNMKEDQQAQLSVKKIVKSASKYAAKHIKGAEAAAEEAERATASRIGSGSRPLQLIVEFSHGAVTHCRRLLSDEI